MATNDYDIEVSAETVAKGREAKRLMAAAVTLWDQFETEATGELGSGTAGNTLKEAQDDMFMDFLRFITDDQVNPGDAA